MESTQRVLVIGDTHIKPGESLKRFDAASNFIVENDIQRVVIIGDFVDMASLSSFERPGSRQLENKRVIGDIEVGKEALRRLHKQRSAFNERQRKAKHYQTPLTIDYIEGNHEYRIKRMWNENARLEGAFDLSREFKGLISSYTPYKEYLFINGVGFTHVPFSSSGPIESVYGVYKVLSYVNIPVIYGHTHKLEYNSCVRTGMQFPLSALNVGCFFEEEGDGEYKEGKLKNYWRGLILVDAYPGGRFDYYTTSLDALMTGYL